MRDMLEFDFIIVGAGSAGSVLAHHLTEDPHATVLVVEAGGTQIPEQVDNTAQWYLLWGTPVDWDYPTVPQAGLNNRVLREPRGKLLGGSSNLYIMQHVRGHSSDYDHWSYASTPGWCYADVLPYFQRLEDQEDESSPWAGHGGPLSVINAHLHQPNPTSQVFLDACHERGYPFTADFNGPTMEGAGWYHLNIKDGKRHSAARAYLLPAIDRTNLTVATHAQVTKLLFEGTRCIGVAYVQNDMLLTARARHEVILAAGAIESPKLLLLSGIGRPDHLQPFDIPVLVDVLGVGENLHDHPLGYVTYQAAQPIPPPQLNLSESALFWHSNPGWLGPDLQLSCAQGSLDFLLAQSHPNTLSILCGVVRPLARGWVRLASADPLAKPLVNPEYLNNAADLDRMVQAMKRARELFATSAFSSWTTTELRPGPDIQCDDELRAFTRQQVMPYWHLCGSCKMGLDRQAVVDPHLRVHGVEGLRVVDASVMPSIPSGNIHTAVLMIAERASDLIKDTYALKKTPSFQEAT